MTAQQPERRRQKVPLPARATTLTGAAFIEDADLVDLYRAILHNLEVEVLDANVKDTTIHELMRERCAFAYVSMKTREGSINLGYSSATDQKNINNLFQVLAEAHLAQIGTGRSADEIDNEMAKVVAAVTEALTQAIPDPAQRARVRDAMSMALADAGL